MKKLLVVGLLMVGIVAQGACPKYKNLNERSYVKLARVCSSFVLGKDNEAIEACNQLENIAGGIEGLADSLFEDEQKCLEKEQKCFETFWGRYIGDCRGLCPNETYFKMLEYQNNTEKEIRKYTDIICKGKEKDRCFAYEEANEFKKDTIDTLSWRVGNRRFWSENK
jgi:hypothetical protein